MASNEKRMHIPEGGRLEIRLQDGGGFRLEVFPTQHGGMALQSGSVKDLAELGLPKGATVSNTKFINIVATKGDTLLYTENTPGTFDFWRENTQYIDKPDAQKFNARLEKVPVGPPPLSVPADGHLKIRRTEGGYVAEAYSGDDNVYDRNKKPLSSKTLSPDFTFPKGVIPPENGYLAIANVSGNTGLVLTPKNNDGSYLARSTGSSERIVWNDNATDFKQRLNTNAGLAPVPSSPSQVVTETIASAVPTGAVVGHMSVPAKAVDSVARTPSASAPAAPAQKITGLEIPEKGNGYVSIKIDGGKYVAQSYDKDGKNPSKLVTLPEGTTILEKAIPEGGFMTVSFGKASDSGDKQLFLNIYNKDKTLNRSGTMEVETEEVKRTTETLILAIQNATPAGADVQPAPTAPVPTKKIENKADTTKILEATPDATPAKSAATKAGEFPTPTAAADAPAKTDPAKSDPAKPGAAGAGTSTGAGTQQATGWEGFGNYLFDFFGKNKGGVGGGLMGMMMGAASGNPLLMILGLILGFLGGAKMFDGEGGMLGEWMGGANAPGAGGKAKFTPTPHMLTVDKDGKPLSGQVSVILDKEGKMLKMVSGMAHMENDKEALANGALVVTGTFRGDDPKRVFEITNVAQRGVEGPSYKYSEQVKVIIEVGSNTKIDLTSEATKNSIAAAKEQAVKMSEVQEKTKQEGVLPVQQTEGPGGAKANIQGGAVPTVKSASK